MTLPQSIKNIYAHKRVLVTGHTGFKGSWLSIWLKKLGAEVIGYSLKPPSDPNNFEACGLQNKLIHVHGDVRDYSHLVSVFKEYQPALVFHLAAQPLVRLSYVEPRLTYETNVMGTVNLLEAIRVTPSVRSAVIVTSDKCYENKEWVWGYRENDPVGGHDPYSSSKGCAELVTAAYTKSFFHPDRYEVAVSSVRAGNVIGGGDWGQDRLIPDCVRSLSQGKPILVRNPKAVRPWQYVLEPLGGYLLLAALMYKFGSPYTGAWNFGPSNDRDILPVEQLVKMMIKYWGSGSFLSSPNPDNTAHEANLLKLDCHKARTLLDWKPKYDLAQAVQKTVKWYKAYYQGIDKEKAYQEIGAQIDKYMQSP